MPPRLIGSTSPREGVLLVERVMTMNKVRSLPLVYVAVLVVGCGGGSSPQQNLQTAQAPSQPINVSELGMTGAAANDFAR